MVICLEQGVDLHVAQLMPLPLASVKSRLVLPFWYRPTRVVPEKGPLNGCVCVCWIRSVKRGLAGTSITGAGFIQARCPFCFPVIMVKALNGT